MISRSIAALFFAVSLVLPALQAQDNPPRLKLLFLGDNGPHRPMERYRQLEPVLRARGIALEYTDAPTALNAKTLSRFDGLIVYANIEKITAEQEQALLDYVAGGKGFIPIHCASYCFHNSAKYTELVGAQFQRHGAGVFHTTIAKNDHPVFKGFGGFESWDETYVHTKHNDKDRIVLEYRETEPWTWVRTHGKGRVFYTAWGHDERTWSHSGFHNLIERGIHWAVGGDPGVVPAYRDKPQMTELPKGPKPFKYVEAKVPFYPKSDRWGVVGEPIATMQLPLAPAEAMKRIVHPVDFELKLFASEPDIKRPICMNWDERGRLWIAESVDYPNDRQSESKGHDRIVICEDTDGDWKADKFTVFADKLSIPTGFTFAQGGVVVVQAPHTLFLKDTDGNDKADVNKILFTGWGTQDTHAGPSNLHYGFDNWIYGSVGYSGFNGAVGGEKHRFGQGFFRFKLPPLAPGGRGQGEGVDGIKLEFLRSTNNNTWGLGFSEDGHIFGSTANGNPSVYLGIPNRYYEQVKGWSAPVLPSISGNAPIHPIMPDPRQVDWHGHFTAAAGHALYTARNYPKEYWNRIAFICEPTGHLVAAFEITPDGAGFRSRNAFNLVASDDEWFAPIMAEVGPDGNVWILDWYNYIVQHNPTPPGFKTGKGNAYETPLRDKKHGRVYRLVPKNAKPSPPITLKDATPEKLVATLKNDNMFWRKHAQRLLVERGKKDVAPGILKLAGDPSVDQVGLNAGTIHALWVLNALGMTNWNNDEFRAIVAHTLEHKSKAVIRNQLLALARAEDTTYFWGIYDHRASVFADSSPQVRLAGLLTLADLPPKTAFAHAYIAPALFSESHTDPLLRDALVAAGARFSYATLGMVPRIRFGLGKQLSNELKAPALDIVARIAEHFARQGEPQHLPSLLFRLCEANPDYLERVLAAMAKGWPKNRKVELDENTEKIIVDLFAKGSPNVKASLIQLTNAWGRQAAFSKQTAALLASFVKTVTDEKQTDHVRLDAIKQVMNLGADDAMVIEEVIGAISPRSSPQLASGLIEAVGSSSSPAVGTEIMKRLRTFGPQAKLAALRVLLRRPESTRIFLDAVEKGQVHLADLSLDQKQTLANYPDRALAERARKLLERGGGLPSPDRQKVIELYLPVIKKMGDIAAGKLVFKKHCATCHQHTGEGQKIGPDLSGVAVHTKEHLLSDILDPNKSVEGNFRMYTVVMDDGKLYTGMLASESKNAIELYDSEGKGHVLFRENIEQLAASNKSLMPEGFEKQLKETELVDLLAFLSQRGKYLPLSLAKVATAVSTRGMFYSEDAEVERLIFKDWSPKTFADVPFHLVDPQGDRVPNVVLLYSPQGKIPPKMPKSVSLPVNSPAKAIHLLSGVSGWGFPYSEKGGVTLIVRLHYADGKSEDHPLKNGEHFADYIRRVDVPGSQFAFALRGQQIRYLAVHPQRGETIERIELVKGTDRTAPVVMAITVETQ